MIKSRTRKELKRRAPYRIPNKAELIVCEGSITEPTYFRAFRKKLRLGWIEVVGPECGSEPINIVKLAITKKNERIKTGIPYSDVWCVIDVEIPPRPTLAAAFQEAEKIQNLHLILSNPFFEYWFLLHFEKVTNPFKEDKELHAALKQVHPSYKKNNIGFEILYERTQTAISHSNQVIKEKGWGPDLTNCNPSTHVHIIVDHLISISR